METFEMAEDITVLCVTAESFPDGILAAHQKLHGIVPFDSTRGYYGISWSEGEDGIVYKAAAGALSTDEAARFGLDTFTIRKGEYVGTTIHNYMDNIAAIGQAFEQLLKEPRLAHDGYCLEVYVNDKDVRCMVPVGPMVAPGEN